MYGLFEIYLLNGTSKKEKKKKKAGDLKRGAAFLVSVISSSIGKETMSLTKNYGILCATKLLDEIPRTACNFN